MFQMLGCPRGRPRAAPSAAALVARPSTLAAPDLSRGEPVIFEMRENRSHLPEAGRQTAVVFGFAWMVLMIVPALKEHWLVLLYSMLTMAVLTFALDRHGRPDPRAELLEFLRHYAADGRISEFATFGLRCAAEEGRAMALLVAAAINQSRRV